MNVFIIVIFIGSVFFTSEKFVNTENAIKFYFTILAVFIGLLIFFIQNSNIKNHIRKLATLQTLRGLFIIGVLQAGYGILQYIGKLPSNHSAFVITGSFENPAGFIAVLSLLFPIGLQWCLKSKGIEQRLVFFSVGLLLFAIVLSGSRTGFLAILISSFFIFFIEFRIFQNVKFLRYFKQILFSSLVIILLVSISLYKLKEDSALGRLFIWKISTEMIKEKPLFGFGYKGFESNYMDYQANYFAKHPQSQYKQLADNVLHPFNEFIKIMVNYGFVGIFLYLFLLSFIFWKILKIKYSHKSILIGAFVSFIILSSFSYPFHYTPVWFSLSYFTLVIFCEKLTEKRLFFVRRILLIGIFVAGIVFLSFKMYNEMKWKTIAEKSLKGMTKKMLPQYEKLYPYMKNNSLFLYNYGAELHIAKQYRKSINILNECQNTFNDYDLQILLADNLLHIGDTNKAIQAYQHAANMIPCRFLPLYRQFEILKKIGNTNKAKRIAQEIVTKDIKVNSKTIETIIESAENFLRKEKM